MDNDLSNFVVKTLEADVPVIKTYVLEKVGPIATEIIKNDEQLKTLFKTVYNILPNSTRMAVSINDFLTFSMNNKYALLDIGETV